MFIQRFVLVLAAVAAAAPFPVEGKRVRQSVVQTKVMAPQVPAQVINAGARNAIPDQYIVLFKPGTKVDEAKALEETVDALDDGEILRSYGPRVLGFAAHLGPDALEIVLDNSLVLSVEANQKMNSSSVTEPALSRGIDRIDQRLLPLNNTFQYTETGKGVHAYVLDTGIRTSHQEFGGRASSDFTAFADSHDCAGHGTHVAGTLGGKTYGVAKKVWLHSVRVMDCNGQGTLSDVIAGVQWITNKRIKNHPAVANMSISGETGMPSLDVMVQDSIDSGVTYVVAAHNRGRDACGYSPARIPDAITVGAVNPKTDVRWVMSNDGPCVDLFAPGVAILSAGIADDKATAFKAGTSMATAYVAGVAALVLQLNPRAKPSDVWNKIHYNNNVFPATPNWAGIPFRGAGSPNELLHWGPLNDGYDDLDPHIPTADGTHYNFQSAGEFVLLHGGSVEIQTRQTPAATTPNPGPDAYDGSAQDEKVTFTATVALDAAGVCQPVECDSYRNRADLPQWPQGGRAGPPRCERQRELDHVPAAAEYVPDLRALFAARQERIPDEQQR